MAKEYKAIWVSEEFHQVVKVLATKNKQTLEEFIRSLIKGRENKSQK